MGAQLEIVQLQAKADYMMKMWNEQVKRLLDEGIAKYFDEIQAEVALAMGVDAGAQGDAGENPVRHVHFSHFIIQ